MKLRKLSVERFGIWNSMALDGLCDGLTVVYGPNGSGKTTLMQFVRAVLYGPAQERAPIHPGEQGGRIAIADADRDLVIHRMWDAASVQPASVEGPGDAEDAVAISELLGDIGRDLFCTLFTVGHSEAEDIDLVVREALADGELVESAAADLARVKRAIAAAQDQDQQLEELIARRAGLAEMLETLEALTADPPEALQAICSEIAAAEQQIQQLQTRLQTEPRVPDVPTVNIDQPTALDSRIKQWQSWQQEVERQITDVRGELREVAARDLQGVSASSMTARGLMTAVEDQVTAIRSHIAADAAPPALRTQLIEGLAQLQDQVFCLCNALSQFEMAERHANLRAEESQLTRCQAEVDAQIRLLLDRRRELQASASPQARASAWEQLQPCESDAHRTRVSGGAPSESADALRAARAGLADLVRERARVEQTIGQSSEARQLEELRLDLNLLTEEIRGATEQRDVHAATRVMLEQLQEDYEARLQPRVLVEASEYLTRLSGEPFRLLAGEDGLSVCVEHPSLGSPQPLTSLSRGERDQVSLSLRLALIRTCARRGTSFPLILDDVFITSDSDASAATAVVLRDFAAEKQQVVFFTCHTHIAEMFRDLGVKVLDLPEQRIEPADAEEPVVTPPWVSAAPQPESLVVKAFKSEIDELTDRPVDADLVATDGNWIFYTQLNTPVSQLAGLSEAQTEALVTRGVRSVEDLLALMADSASQKVSYTGLTAEHIRALQAQASLSCRVPMLRREHAELLVECGFDTPEKLASVHPGELFKTVSTHLASEPGSRFVRDSNPFDRQMAINWVRSAGHSRTLWHSREQPHPESQAVAAMETSDRISVSAPETEAVAATQQRVLGQTVLRKRNRGRSSSRSIRARTARSAKTRIDPGADDSARTGTPALRFHLDRSAPVEAAPSIGPKTAERLAKVRILTVDDLLAAEPEVAASELGHRRIKAETVRQWQDQAILVCCVPELRGHDAQILVALGITTPEELSACAADELFARVAPFVETSEGERILRNGRKPDLEEVAWWIRCASQSRTLRAA